MPTPDVPLRLELSFEVPGTAEQVWDAIATANGMSSWFMRTEIDEREGGAFVIHMGDETSEGTVTTWEPPRRLVYEEPDWAALAQHDGAAVTPLVSEFLVEARSGGTCVVRVVTSGFGTGADWEQEFFDDMERGWVPFFEHLRLYLTHFAGQRVTSMEVNAKEVPGSAEALRASMRADLGTREVGDPVVVRDIVATVERIDDIALLLRVSDPVPGYLGLYAHDNGNGTAWGQLTGYFFSDDAQAFVEREQKTWKEWLESVHAAPAHR